MHASQVQWQFHTLLFRAILLVTGWILMVHGRLFVNKTARLVLLCLAAAVCVAAERRYAMESAVLSHEFCTGGKIGCQSQHLSCNSRHYVDNRRQEVGFSDFVNAFTFSPVWARLINALPF
jgi:hypothetical protein